MKPLLGSAFLALTALSAAAFSNQDEKESTYAETFDAHWEALRDGYPYFELYGVDWEAERDEHRPKAIAAANEDEFAWELTRLVCALPDPHVSFVPNLSTIVDRWSVPDIEAKIVGRRSYVQEWVDGTPPGIPEKYAADPHAYPEILTIEGTPMVGVAELLAGGPVGTTFELRLGWPDGTETQHEFRRPDEPNVAPEPRHFGEDWLVVGRFGSIGYLGIRTFNPKMATLGPDGKMTTMLRAALAELKDTQALVLDFQSNGGGMVAASDPFLGHLIERSISYQWGNAGGKRRTIRPRSPRYRGALVAIVDERSASGGEWAPRILRDAERATVIGGRTSGAEAAVLTSTGPDGSVINYSGWPMIEPGRKPFQEVGIELDHELHLTIDAVREFGYEEARTRARRARFAKALEILGGSADDVEAMLELSERGLPPKR